MPKEIEPEVIVPATELEMLPEPVRKKYLSFRDAWVHELELRKYCMIEGVPRYGLKPEDVKKANKLILEYS